MNFRNSFLEKCNNLMVGEDRQIDTNLYLNASSNDLFRFFNEDKSFVMNLRFDTTRGENLLDSLIDLRKSIIINDRA